MRTAMSAIATSSSIKVNAEHAGSAKLPLLRRKLAFAFALLAPLAGFIPINAPYQRPRASDFRYETEVSSEGFAASDSWAAHVSHHDLSRCARGSDLPEQHERTINATHQTERCGVGSRWR